MSWYDTFIILKNIIALWWEGLWEEESVNASTTCLFQKQNRSGNANSHFRKMVGRAEEEHKKK